MNLNDLSAPLLLEIFSYLPGCLNNLILSLVCHKWKHLLSEHPNSLELFDRIKRENVIKYPNNILDINSYEIGLYSLYNHTVPSTFFKGILPLHWIGGDIELDITHKRVCASKGSVLSHWNVTSSHFYPDWYVIKKKHLKPLVRQKKITKEKLLRCISLYKYRDNVSLLSKYAFYDNELNLFCYYRIQFDDSQWFVTHPEQINMKSYKYMHRDFKLHYISELQRLDVECPVINDWTTYICCRLLHFGPERELSFIDRAFWLVEADDDELSCFMDIDVEPPMELHLPHNWCKNKSLENVIRIVDYFEEWGKDKSVFQSCVEYYITEKTKDDIDKYITFVKDYSLVTDTVIASVARWGSKQQTENIVGDRKLMLHSGIISSLSNTPASNLPCLKLDREDMINIYLDRTTKSRDSCYRVLSGRSKNNISLSKKDDEDELLLETRDVFKTMEWNEANKLREKMGIKARTVVSDVKDFGCSKVICLIEYGFLCSEALFHGILSAPDARPWMVITLLETRIKINREIVSAYINGDKGRMRKDVKSELRLWGFR